MPSIIITCNLKDFPKKSIIPHNVTALHSDDFIHKIIETSAFSSLTGLKKEVKGLRNPPVIATDVLKAFEKVELTKTASALKSINLLIFNIHNKTTGIPNSETRENWIYCYSVNFT